MSKNNKEFNENPMEILSTFAKMAMNNPEIYSFFGGLTDKQKVEQSPYVNLGEGYELRPIEMKDKKGNPIPNIEKYSHLYRDGEQISKEVFRKGGMCNGYRDGHCELIHYVKEKGKQFHNGYSWGTHVIVDAFGRIMLQEKGTSYPRHLGGNIGRLNNDYYNLLNGEKIMTVSSSGSINSANYIIVEHRYDWYDKNLPLGVYRINKMTCQLEKIDDLKK